MHINHFQVAYDVEAVALAGDVGVQGDVFAEAHVERLQFFRLFGAIAEIAYGFPFVDADGVEGGAAGEIGRLLQRGAEEACRHTVEMAVDNPVARSHGVDAFGHIGEGVVLQGIQRVAAIALGVGDTAAGKQGAPVFGSADNGVDNLSGVELFHVDVDEAEDVGREARSHLVEHPVAEARHTLYAVHAFCGKR